MPRTRGFCAKKEDRRAIELKIAIEEGKMRLGINHKELAKKVGMKERTLYEHLSDGCKSMRYGELISILDCLKVPAETRAKIL